MLRYTLEGVHGLLQPDKDWTYTKKREAQEIIPGLWLGPFGAARDREFLGRAGITDVLVVRAPEEARIIAPKYPDVIRYEVLECRDSPFESIIVHFPTVKAMVDGILSRGGRILVHDNAGLSSSAAIVIAYVMDTHSITADEAYYYVYTRRQCINVNTGFRKQLREYEVLRKVNSVAFVPNPAGAHGQKRPLEISPLRLPFPAILPLEQS